MDEDTRGEEDLQSSEEFWDVYGPPDRDEIAWQDKAMLRRQRKFRLAAECVARAFSQVPEVEKVVLFGSVAVPLEKEVPRFRKFRRAGIPVWHECKDLDLAVWVTNLGCLHALQRTRGRALNDLYRKTQVGVAHHQVEVFVMEPRTDCFLGCLCIFGKCPKGKRECLVPGCGKTPFLKQHKGFVFNERALEPPYAVLLYDRSSHRAGGDAST